MMFWFNVFLMALGATITTTGIIPFVISRLKSENKLNE